MRSPVSKTICYIFLVVLLYGCTEQRTQDVPARPPAPCEWNCQDMGFGWDVRTESFLAFYPNEDPGSFRPGPGKGIRGNISLQKILGLPLFEEIRKGKQLLVESKQTVSYSATYKLERLSLFDPVAGPLEALFLRPGAASLKSAVVIAVPGHDQELDDMADSPEVRELIKYNLAILIPSIPNFTSRATTPISCRALIASGMTLMGLRIMVLRSAVDYLMMQPEIDSAKIALMGHSGGSFLGAFATAFDPRIKVFAGDLFVPTSQIMLHETEPEDYWPDQIDAGVNEQVLDSLQSRPTLFQPYGFPDKKEAAKFLADNLAKLKSENSASSSIAVQKSNNLPEYKSNILPPMNVLAARLIENQPKTPQETAKCFSNIYRIKSQSLFPKCLITPRPFRKYYILMPLKSEELNTCHPQKRPGRMIVTLPEKGEGPFPLAILIANDDKGPDPEMDYIIETLAKKNIASIEIRFSANETGIGGEGGWFKLMARGVTPISFALDRIDEVRAWAAFDKRFDRKRVAVISRGFGPLALMTAATREWVTAASCDMGNAGFGEMALWGQLAGPSLAPGIVSCGELFKIIPTLKASIRIGEVSKKTADEIIVWLKKNNF